MKNENWENMHYIDYWKYQCKSVQFVKETKMKLFENLEDKENSKKWEKVDFYLNFFKHSSQYEKELSGDKIEFDKNDPDWLRFLAKSSVLSREEREWLKDFSIKDILESVKNTKDKLSEPLIYQAIAVLFANLQVWKSPYRWLEWGENSWVWIKALLGKKHYNQFLEDKQKCLDTFSMEENRDKLQDVLANAEMTYIINNVRWSNPHNMFFWFHEWVDDSSIKLLSGELIEKLDDCIWFYFNKSSSEQILSIQD